MSLLDGIRGVVSAVSHKPVNSGDLGMGMEWVAAVAGLPVNRVAMLHQMHGETVHRASGGEAGRNIAFIVKDPAN